jgi:dihydrofolate reductase
MSKTFFDIGLSLDGFIAGENRSPKNPMGGQAPAIHNWMFIQKAFWEHLHTTGGEKDDQDGNLIRGVFARTGAYVMGKRMFDEGEASWPEGLFKAPVYVLTHEKRQPWVQKDNTTFYFVNDGMESAYAKAKASAGNKDIRIQGGADCIRQYLNAGYIDEFTLHIAPSLLSSGIRFFEGVDKTKFSFNIINTIQSPAVTHITYAVTNHR